MSDNRLKAYVAIKQNGLCPKRQIVCHCYIAVLKRDSFQSILCILLTQSEWEVAQVKLHFITECYMQLSLYVLFCFAMFPVPNVCHRIYK